VAAFRQWVKNCFDSLVDPDKDAEVSELTQLLHQRVIQQKKAFSLSSVLGDRPHKPRHLEQAKRNVYQKILARAWKDGRVQPEERKTLDWLAKQLELPAEQVRTVNAQAARIRFAEALATAMDDNEITAEESAFLEEIAAAGGTTLQNFVRLFFRDEGEVFLRGIFGASIGNNGLRDGAIERLVTTAKRLGLSRTDLMLAIEPQAVRLIEHALADAKQDDALSPAEEETINYLLHTFTIPLQTQEYVRGELWELKALRDVKQGRLPSLGAPDGISLRAGELVHHYGDARWERIKVLRSGPSSEVHDGILVITDCRLLFSSFIRSEAISFQRIVGYNTWHGHIEVQVKGKPVDRFAFAGHSRVPNAIFESAVEMANQTLRNPDGPGGRHIPRDVRQRVWQRYGGKCADCAATMYLEFDHIVPVAKGGSNADGNVQLLCRGCNSKKSDMI
jgi:hypothetical protein